MADGFKVINTRPGRPIGVGMLGYGSMGRAHSTALQQVPQLLPLSPRLVALCGRNEGAVAQAAERYGFEGYYTDWRQLVADDRIELFCNLAPNSAHLEPCILAAQASKHVLCEKPLARTAPEAKVMLDAVTKAGVKHMTAFNLRFIPAVRYVRELIQGGALGRIYHVRAHYLSESHHPYKQTPMRWRLSKAESGSGVLGDLGSHMIDLARFLVGEISTVSGMLKTFIDERPIGGTGQRAKVDVDDAFVATLAFASGAIGTVEATKFAAGHTSQRSLEINGEQGSIRLDLERPNEVELFWAGESKGFQRVMVSERSLPSAAPWWPSGGTVATEHTYLFQMAHFLDCIERGAPVDPLGATFLDGYRVAAVCDAIIEAAESRRLVDVVYEA
ncbi:MAG TPA: Gfo/Idh/MocA family oxidoreductase [Symbiobacteriaceae bacterium]|nr:Gfo/Idh/MocA family oxidoreductase [Symbiobacteriaceae bacterium]